MLDANNVVQESLWDYGPGQLMRTPEAWLLWFIVFSIQAGGLVLNTNLGLIVASRGSVITAAEANTTFSAAQSFGRLSAGALSGLMVQRGIPRPWFFAILTISTAAGHVLFFFPGPAALSLGITLAAYSFGAQYPVIAVCVTELFGPRRFASNYMIYDGMPGAFAALFVAKLLASWSYNASAGDDGSCHGGACFDPMYGLVVASQIMAVSCAALLAHRARGLYKQPGACSDGR